MRRLRSVYIDSCFSLRFEMDYILASLNKPYVVILDGITSTLIPLSDVPRLDDLFTQWGVG